MKNAAFRKEKLIGHGRVVTLCVRLVPYIIIITKRKHTIFSLNCCTMETLYSHIMYTWPITQFYFHWNLFTACLLSFPVFYTFFSYYFCSFLELSSFQPNAINNHLHTPSYNTRSLSLAPARIIIYRKCPATIQNALTQNGRANLFIPFTLPFLAYCAVFFSKEKNLGQLLTWNSFVQIYMKYNKWQPLILLLLGIYERA